LAGEPGIGKTRLAGELADHASRRGFVVARGQCREGRGVPAFWPWTRAVEPLVERLPSEVVAGSPGWEASEIGRLVGGARGLLPDPAPPPALDPEVERFRSCDALSRFLCRMAREQPLMVVVEDLHWADGASLELLGHLATAIVDVPMLIVVTYRSVGPAAQGRLTEALAELARQPLARHFDVHGIDREAVRQLMTVTGHRVDEALVGAVYRRTQGNPFFLVETLRLHSTTGDGPELGSVPTGVRDVIRQRLALLPAATVDALRAASVLGVEFQLSILSAMLDCDGDAALALLDPAFEAALVVDGLVGPGWYQFSHVLVRDTLYADLGTAARPRRHHRAALALEAVHGPEDGAHVMALAEHWFHAVPVAPADRGVGAALRAARWATQMGAPEQVEEQLRAASLLLRTMPAGRRREELELRIQYEAAGLRRRTGAGAARFVG
jgi:predicted ATPase